MTTDLIMTVLSITSSQSAQEAVPLHLQTSVGTSERSPKLSSLARGRAQYKLSLPLPEESLLPVTQCMQDM
jgi:hypothetical protein